MNEFQYADVDVAHNDADADILPCLFKPYDPAALLFIPPLVPKHLSSQMHAHTHTNTYTTVTQIQIHTYRSHLHLEADPPASTW